MWRTTARLLRDICLLLALLVFAAGIVDILLLSFDASLGTGLMVRTGLSPESFAQGAMFLVLLSIAFGVVELDKR